MIIIIIIIVPGGGMKRRNIYGVARVWKGKEEEEDPRCCNKMVGKTKLKERSEERRVGKEVRTGGARR